MNFNRICCASRRQLRTHGTYLHSLYLATLLTACCVMPRDAHAAVSGALWPGFNAPGFSNTAGGDVFLLEYDGRLVALGPFESVGRTAAFGAAAWDGVQWTGLGAGIFGERFPGRVLGATVLGHDLVAALSLRDTWDEPAPVAFLRWDGQRWQTMTTLPAIWPGQIRTVGSYRGELIVAGTFDALGGVPVTNIAAWDGAGWHALGMGLDAAVRGSSPEECEYYNASVISVFALQDRLYAAGLFDRSGDRRLNNIAEWDGQTWRTLRGGLEGWVSKLGAYQGDLVASGGFHTVEGVPSPGLARWDGAHWQVFGNGAPHAWNVTTLAADGTRLFATSEDWEPVEHEWHGALHVWDGTGWSAQPGAAGTKSLVPFAGRLYAAGRFETFAHSPVNGLVSADLADLSQWSSPAPGAGFSGLAWYDQWGPSGTYVAALTAFQGDLVVAGPSLHPLPRSQASVLRRSGESWITLGEFDGAVRALAVAGDHLIAAGDFQHAGTDAVAGIAEWDGVEWRAIGGGIPEGGIQAVVPYGSGIMAIGWFSYVQGQLLHSIAYCGGTRWERVGSANVIQGVLTAAVYRGHLIVGGDFRWDGRRQSRSIAEWDGVEWREFQGGANGAVHKIVVDGDKLYAVGTFTQIGGVAARSGAVWDGSMWSALPADEGATLAAIAPVGANLYAVSHVLRGSPVRREYTSQLVSWNGTRWEPLAPRSPGYVADLLVIGTSVYAGGSFHFFGGQPAAAIARWDVIPAPQSQARLAFATGRAANALAVQSSPGGDGFRIAYRIGVPGDAELGVYDVRGRLVQRLAMGPRAAGAYESLWGQQDSRGRAVARGVYFVRLAIRGDALVRKIVVMPHA